MASCAWCLAEMTTATTCSVAAFHRDGRRIDLLPYGAEPGWPARRATCGDCGVARGGWHHPGCDMQRCPICRGQMMSCGCRFDEDGPDIDEGAAHDVDDLVPYGVDANGALTEVTSVGGVPVIVHYADVPASDITTIDGIRCTSALRTVIDLACEVEPDDFEVMTLDALDRRLFTVDEAHRRLAQPDMATHPGAARLGDTLRRFVDGTSHPQESP